MNLSLFKFFSCFFLVFLLIFQIRAQTQIGLDINGEAAGNSSGTSVSMPDAYTVAIGAPYNGVSAGHVRVYRWTSGAGGWVQKGMDINGEASLDKAGQSVSMPDSNTVAIGAWGNDGSGSIAGHVRIYRWTGSTWVQKGMDIDAEAAGDYSGWSVSMPDSNTVAIGALANDGSFSDAGHVRVYQWTGGMWVQKGIDIDGEGDGDESGHSVSMPDSNTVAIGAYRNDGNGYDAGHVRIYQWNGSGWIQKGMDIDGEATNDYFGYSVSMSDSNTIAIGANGNDGSGSDAGHTRVYRWNGSAWVQKGMDMDGEAEFDYSGLSVSMPDSNTVAIGARGNDGSGSFAGHARIYQWDGSAWIQKGMDIDGEAAGDSFGRSVSMPDSNTVAIGGPANDGSGSDAGHVRIYSLSGILNIQHSDFGNALSAYPVPTNGTFTLDLGSEYPDVTVTISNPLGQELSRLSFSKTKEMVITLPGEAGIYFIGVNSHDEHAGSRSAVLKVVKGDF